MNKQTALIITSIASPNAILKGMAEKCISLGVPFIVIGDEPSPADFSLEGCDFYSLERQALTGFASAGLCPTRHYARKNLGYLLAIRGGANIIVETDDDNIPLESFWGARERSSNTAVLRDSGWANVYRYFSDAEIWPRGLPLDEIRTPPPSFESLAHEGVDCPIQQGLANDNPDVDAIYRLVSPLPQSFRNDRRVALGRGAWCPFNSQNTSWWRDAFPLLYLPAYCSFRMTDIWRSFIAQKIAWVNGWSVLFHEPTVRQERNEHSLMRDFRDEVPGYLNNREICERLDAVELHPGIENIAANLRLCYELLVTMQLVDQKELPLLEAWINDVAAATAV